MDEEKITGTAEPENTNETPVIEEIVKDEPAASENTAETEVLTKAAVNGKPKKNWKTELKDWIMSIAVALFVVFLIRSFLFQIIRVDGLSMYSTLDNNERLFVTVLDVRLNGVDRDDVVICHYPNRGTTNFVKRVVAVPGDIVYREDGMTHVCYEEDGKTVDVVLDDPADYGKNLAWRVAYPDDDYEPYTLGENEYFVVGDNRFNSHDSRDWNDRDDSYDVGPITGNMIIGHVRYVFWPLNNAREVK